MRRRLLDDTPPPPGLASRRLRIAHLALAAGLLLAGCASDGDTAPAGPDPEDPVSSDDDPTASPAPSATPADPPTALPAELTITLDESGEGPVRTFTLTCDPAGGDHPTPQAACDALARAGIGAFDPVPPDVACTEQWGGPQRATVEGFVDGTPVSGDFARTNGCEIARWDALAPLLGSSGAA